MGLFDLLFGKKNHNESVLITKNTSDNRINESFPVPASSAISVSCTKMNVDSNTVDKLNECFIAIDTETTGLSPTCDRIIEIAAVKFENGNPVDSYSTLVNALIPIPPQVTRVNHITDDMIRTAPSERDAYNGLVRFLGSGIDGKILLCAHNASFDFSFIENTFRRLGISANFLYIDTLSLCRRYIPGLINYKQATIESFFGISNQSSHRAASDAEACGRILVNTLFNCKDVFEVERTKESGKRERAILSSEEIEVCAVILDIISSTGCKTDWVRFKRHSTSVAATCSYYSFVEFKFTKKGRYIILPSGLSTKSSLISESCTKSEGGAVNKRVYFQSPMEIKEFSSFIIDRFQKSYENWMDCVKCYPRAKAEAEEFISLWTSLDDITLNKVLEEIENKDYSRVPIPEIEVIITKEDVQINAIYERIPFESIRVNKSWNESLNRVFWDAEEKRKEKLYSEALVLYEKARSLGFIEECLYTGFAQTYHALKDYDNEIVILDEGIDHLEKQKTPLLITRRDNAIKALYKKQESDRIAKQKEEEKRRIKEEKEALKKQKASSGQTSLGRPVIQFDDDGNVLAEFSSVTEAAANVGISPKGIRDAAKGVQKHAAGYCWKYKDLHN